MSTISLPIHPLKALRLVVIAGFALIISSIIFTAPSVHAAPVAGFDAGRIIDDDIFTLKNSMDASQIQAFLNSKVPVCDTNGTQISEYGGGTRAQWGAAHNNPAPFTCLRDFSEGGKSSAQIIYDTSQQYSINPQVLLVLLQKEQGLITDTWPLTTQYRTATGYGCPDTAACDSQYYGFTNQVRWAATMFRAVLNSSPTWYSPYVLGNNTILWNPSSACGNSTVNITTRATQALYNYTPYRPNQAALNAGYGTGDSCSSYGNRNFYLYFTDWFGSTRGNWYYTCRYGANIQNTQSGPRVLRNRLPNSSKESLSLIVSNNTGSGCVEVHTWANSQLQSWLQHIGTNSYTFDPAHSTVVSMHNFTHTTNFFKIDYRNTGSGKLELHGWDDTVQKWVSHVATASGPIDPVNSDVIAADLDGDGADSLYIINYAGTASGMIEVHGLSYNTQQWVQHTVTNLSAIDPTKGRVIAADIDGNGKDELTYVKFGDVQSGMVELHTWTPNLKQWARHTATNLPSAAYNNTADDITAMDNNGDGRDELLYIKYSNTQSARTEVHGWSYDQQQWISHIATSSGSF